MKKYSIIIVAAFLLMIGINAYFFRSFYNMQISQQRNLLLEQTKVCSNEIERVVQKFESDLNYILFSDDIDEMFLKENSDGMRKLELFYSTYSNLIKNIDIYDNNKNVLNLFRDKKKNFITDSYIAQRQRNLSSKDDVIMHNSEYQYVLPVFKDNELFANILVTINLKDYLLSELEKFHLEGYTWQWVIDLENNEVFNLKKINYSIFEGQGTIIDNLNKDREGLIIQNISNDSINLKLLSVYAPMKVLNKKFGVLMSVNYRSFLNPIFTKLTSIAVFTLLIFLLVTIYFTYDIVRLKKKIKS